MVGPYDVLKAWLLTFAPTAPTLWGTAWALRFWNVRTYRRAMITLLQLAYAAIVGLLCLSQVMIYQRQLGFENNRYFFLFLVSLIVEAVVYFKIGRASEKDRDRRFPPATSGSIGKGSFDQEAMNTIYASQPTSTWRSAEFPSTGDLPSPRYPRPPRKVMWALLVHLGLVLIFITGAAYRQFEIRRSALFQTALKQVISDKRVIERFGAPISAEWLVQGNSWIRPSSITIPIKGSHTTGAIYATSSSGDSNPQFVQLEVVDAQEEYLINLLSAGPSISPDKLPNFGRVYLIPLSKSAERFATILPQYYKKKLGLTIDLLPVLNVPAALEDTKRNQLMAERLIDLIRDKYTEQADDPEAIFIGITDKDAYVRAFDWPFTFNFRQDQRFGIISLARLDPSFFHHLPDDAILTNRLKKVATKLLGVMHYRLEAGPLPFSVLGSQASLTEIDRAGEDILASDIPESEGGAPCLTFTFSNAKVFHSSRLLSSCADPHFSETHRGVVRLDLRLGLLNVRQDDLILAGSPRIVMSRAYRNQYPYHRAFGIGADHPYNSFLYSRDQMATINLHTETGSGVRFDRTTAGTGFNPDFQFVNRGNGGDFNYGRLYWKDSQFQVINSFGARYSFQPCAGSRVPCFMTGFRNPQGDRLAFMRQADGDLLKLEAIPDPSANAQRTAVYFMYNSKHSITQMQSSKGETIKYVYDDRQRLIDVQNATGEATKYAYDDSNNLTSLRQGNSLILRAACDPKGRVTHLDLPDVSYNISYLSDDKGQIVEADLAAEGGSTTKVYMLNDHYSVATSNPQARSQSNGTAPLQ